MRFILTTMMVFMLGMMSPSISLAANDTPISYNADDDVGLRPMTDVITIAPVIEYDESTYSCWTTQSEYLGFTKVTYFTYSSTIIEMFPEVLYEPGAITIVKLYSDIPFQVGWQLNYSASKKISEKATNYTSSYLHINPGISGTRA